MIFKDGVYLGREIYAFSGDWLIVFDDVSHSFLLFNCMKPSVVRCLSRKRLPEMHDGRCDVEYYPSFDCALGGLFLVLLEPMGFKLLPHYFDSDGFDKTFVCVKCKNRYSVFLLTYMKNVGSLCENCYKRGSSPIYGGDTLLQH